MSALYFYNDLFFNLSFEGSKLNTTKLKEIYSDLDCKIRTYDLDDDGEVDWVVFKLPEVHGFEEPILYFIDNCISILKRFDTNISLYGIEKIIPIFSMYHWQSTGFSMLPSTSEVLVNYGVEIHFDIYPSTKKRFIDRFREEKKKVQSNNKNE